MCPSSEHAQKTLPLNLRAEYIFQTFVEGPNSATLDALRHFLAPSACHEEHLFFLWGQSGSGKSHLLQAAAHYINNMGQSAFYMSFDHITQLDPSVLDQLEHYQIICLDQIQDIPNHGPWEEKFFCCLNTIEENSGTKIILSSNQNIHQMNIKRSETTSRLSASACYQLLPLHEEDLINAFKVRAKYRQIPIHDDVIQYLLNHTTRDSATLFGILNRLDAASLQEKKLISVPFLKKIMAQIEA